MLLAAVHHLLLEGAAHPLASRYRSVCELRGVRFEPADDATIVEEFTSFCRTFEAPIAERCVVRKTQTNEVGRCAVLRAVLGVLAERGVAELSLLDAGCSAGLNLFVDAYGYDYGAVRAGPEGAAPVLRCELRGAVPALSMPAVTGRVGLDLSPIDVRDADQVAWLLACLWPDDVGRIARLHDAVGVATARRDEVTLVEGDMVGQLAEAAARTDADATLLVANCWSAAYLEPPRRRALADAVAAVASSRPVAWVTMEPRAVARDLGVLDEHAVLSHQESSAVCLTEFDRGAPRSTLLAETHAHGAWLAWAADPMRRAATS